MSLSLRKLENVEPHPAGGYTARCPACAEGGGDKTWRNHLRIFAGGTYACAAHQGDAGREHRRRIYALARGKGRCARPRMSAEAKARKALAAKLQALTIEALACRAEVFSKFSWEKFTSESGPVPVDQGTNWRLWLSLWKPEDRIWVGGFFDSERWFGTAAELRRDDPDKPPGDAQSAADLTRGWTWQPYATVRKDILRAEQRFVVVECDDHPRDQQLAVIRYAREALQLRLLYILDSAGKSLHGVFDAPQLPSVKLAEINAILVGLGADPQALSKAATRIPGAKRQPNPRKPESPFGGLQKIIWLNPEASTANI